ncbi:helix-turn-helix transcriptional regulator [Intrasporangium mesophilum]
MGDGVVGRQREWALITRLLSAASHEGRPSDDGYDRRLVIRGPAGIGKTHLLRGAASEATERGFVVRRCTGRQRDRDLPLAGLEELLGAEFSEFAGSELAPTEPDSHLPAAMQALRIVLNRAQKGPVLLVVDDAQWIDRPSWEALLFVLRRIHDDPVVVLVAVTSGTRGDERLEGLELPTVTLEPLRGADAELLLNRVAPDLPATVATVVLRESAGLPLALVELAVAAGRDGSRPLTGTLPVTDRLEQTYVRALSGLPASSAALLRVLSLGESRSTGEVIAAAARYLERDVTVSELHPALDARLAEMSTDGFELWFASPTASAVVAALTPVGERHRIHLAWADSLAADPERALWHRAAGTLGPAAGLESDLLALAERAAERGDIDVASATLEQAARFADDPQRAAHLQLQAAQYAMELDDAPRCRRLLAAINPHALRSEDRARVRWLVSMLREGWAGADTLAEFIDSAQQIHDAGADRAALEALMSVSLRFHFTNPAQVIRDSAVRLLDSLSLDGDAALERLGGLGLIAPVSRGRELLERMPQIAPMSVQDPLTLFRVGIGALAVGDPASCRTFLTAAESRCRSSGRLGTLANALIGLAFATALTGQVGQARVYATEGVRLATETNQRRWVGSGDIALSYVAALRGDADEAERIAVHVEAVLSAVGLSPMLSHVELARGIVAASIGDHAAAVAHLWRPFNPDEPSFHPQVRFWGLTHLAFAAVRTGDVDVLDAAVDVARRQHDRAPAPLLTTALAFVEALTAPDTEAAAAYEHALAAMSTSWPFERARVQLSYGSWLRRRQRPEHARAQLELASAAFTALGTRPWAQSAQRELRAAGGAIQATVSPVDVLSPQELQVAELVSDGLTNRQVAERLFVSPRTIESHLYRIYAKVGAANRTDLARILKLGGQTS